MKTNIAMSICFKNDIIVYPVEENGSWFIEFKEKGKKPFRYKKSLRQGKETSDALQKTYLHLSKKILKE